MTAASSPAEEPRKWKPDDVVGIWQGFDLETKDPEEYPIEFWQLSKKVQSALNSHEERAYAKICRKCDQRAEWFDRYLTGYCDDHRHDGCHAHFVGRECEICEKQIAAEDAAEKIKWPNNTKQSGTDLKAADK